MASDRRAWALSPVEAHLDVVLGPGELAHRGVDLCGHGPRWRVLGGHKRADDDESRVGEDPGNAGSGRLSGVAVALLGRDDVVAHLRDQLVLDGLEHGSAVAEEPPVRTPDDGPQTEPVLPVAPASPVDPG